MFEAGIRYHSTIEDIARLPRLEAMFEGLEEEFLAFYETKFKPQHRKQNNGRVACYRCLSVVDEPEYIALTLAIESRYEETMTVNLHESCYDAIVGVQPEQSKQSE